MGNEDGSSGQGAASRIGLVLSPLLALLLYLLLPDPVWNAAGELTAGLPHAGKVTAAVACWMAGWWLTEAIPIPATSLLPIVLFPLFGATSLTEATAPYAHHLIFLFMGGFMVAMAMQRWDLHRRLALAIILLVGTRPSRMIAGFMAATAFLSMWVSNTAVVTMMLPIAISVSELARQRLDHGASGEGAAVSGRRFSTALMLGVAYSASIGGTGTLVGTPPNALFAAFAESEFGISVSFVSWMRIGLPIVVIFLPLTWLFLTRVAFPLRIQRIPGGRDLIRAQLKEMGPVTTAEKRVLSVFLLVAVLWLTRPVLVEIASSTPLRSLSDSMIAIFGAVLLFLIPAGDGRGARVLNWETAVRLPWGVLLLFGGGLSLAAAMKNTHVATFIGNLIAGAGSLPVFWLVLLTVSVVIFLTELTSNTATTAVFLPIVAAVAAGVGAHPFTLAVPAVLAASFAFMMPVATPPNAIVFGSGAVTIPQMCRAGLWLNVSGIVVISTLTYGLLAILFGVAMGP